MNESPAHTRSGNRFPEGFCGGKLVEALSLTARYELPALWGRSAVSRAGVRTRTDFAGGAGRPDGELDLKREMHDGSCAAYWT
jgi:hypothetical protein